METAWDRALPTTKTKTKSVNVTSTRVNRCTSEPVAPIAPVLTVSAQSKSAPFRCPDHRALLLWLSAVPSRLDRWRPRDNKPTPDSYECRSLQRIARIAAAPLSAWPPPQSQSPCRISAAASLLSVPARSRILFPLCTSSNRCNSRALSWGLLCFNAWPRLHIAAVYCGLMESACLHASIASSCFDSDSRHCPSRLPRHGVPLLLGNDNPEIADCGRIIPRLFGSQRQIIMWLRQVRR